ncbi:nuclear envelope pore membrane protein POM 121-like isoform X2 [Scleropages formosus]|uniref:nuclear envelope pore membrane protein POM 121-like isoform X2 n=1 Tax=Scleropages formosus TaxID=113540 RepID=UPI0010FA7BC8|nr:nuclear envelope pore membrane protein POM 121-like isoform X2 [Scleropages formosus]
MSPREKWWLAFLSLVAFSLTLCFGPLFLSALLLLGLSCVACFHYKSEWHVHPVLGPHPRVHLKVPPGPRGWLPGRDANGLPSRDRLGRVASRDAAAAVAVSTASERHLGVCHKDAESSDSPALLSPRDFLMGSYLAKADGPALGGTRELRERLSRPNEAADTPRRRLSFGETLGTVGKLMVSPQQTGSSVVGILPPPPQQDGFRKKNFLTQRNSPVLHSPVTVKTPALDKTRPQVFDHLISQSSGLGPLADHSSPEAVPSSLRMSRKREVDKVEDRSSAAGHLSKRSRDTFGTEARFTITPQRRYPLQQTGSYTVGVLPLTQQGGSRKKNFLPQRNSPVLHNPVTVKIPRLDKSRPQVFDRHISPSSSQSPRLGPPADPCSLEAVLSVLKESRKREVDRVEDRACATSQKSKRSRHESTGSSSSAVELLLANGAPSQLLPKAGNLKRGLNMSMVEECSLKRSRTSSTSSGGSSLTPCGVLSSARNPIRSSYSSSLGSTQRKKASGCSPLSSTGSSHSQTPERTSKKPREDEVHSPSSLSTLRPDSTKMDDTPAPGNAAPAPKAPAPATSSESGGSEGTRKRKIQLVSSQRGDRISLPPPPELGYTVTVKDLDLEKKAALSRIQKVLQEPEPVKPTPTPMVPSFAEPASSTAPSAPTDPLLRAPVPIVSTAAPVCSAALPPAANVGPALAGTGSQGPTSVQAGVAPGSGSPLLECLKMMNSPGASPATSSPAAPPLSAVTTSSTAPSAASSSSGAVKLEPIVTTAQPAVQPSSSVAPPSSAQPPSSLASSAFAQVLAQPLQPSSSSLTAVGNLKLGLRISAQSPAPTVAPSSGSSSPLLTSAFKPIFGTAVSGTPSSSTSTLAVPAFKPIFGGGTDSPTFGQPVSSAPAPAPSSAADSSVNGPSLFRGLSGAPAAPAPTDPAPVKSLFGNWSSTPLASSTQPTSATSTGGIFQFGGTPAATATAALSLSSTSTTTATTFQFGSVATTAAATQSSLPGTFTFGQSVGSFSGFSTAAPTTAATVPATATAGQTAFSFGKSSFNGSAQVASSALPGATKPFDFGGANSGSTTFPFGTAASTAAPTFGTPSKLAFGGGLPVFGFGSPTVPSATPTFGSITQTPTPAPHFAFGGATSTQPGSSAPLQSTAAQPATGGFNFGASLSGGQFGAPSSANPTAQASVFTFGASNTQDNKPAFGTSSPAFGQSTPGAPVSFGIPSTPTPNFSGLAPSPFGASAAASFSIGSGSKPSGARQRLQARRQHPRKK